MNKCAKVQMIDSLLYITKSKFGKETLAHEKNKIEIIQMVNVKYTIKYTICSDGIIYLKFILFKFLLLK